MNSQYNKEIDEFDLKNIERNSPIGIIGKRGTGKSYLCRDILNHMIDIPYGIVISTTEPITFFYSENFPNFIIHTDFDPSIVENLIKRQKEIKEHKKFENIDTRALIVLDDCLSTKDLNNKCIQELIFYGKCLNITFILITQLASEIRPALQTSFNYVFLLHDDNTTNQELMFKQYGCNFNSFSEFKNVYDKITQDFGCLVLLIGSSFYDSKKVFKYKAIIN